MKRRLLRMLLAAGALVVPLVCVEAALRIAGPRWLRARMDEMAAGRRVLGEQTSAFDFIESDRGAYIRFRPGTSFALVDPEYRTTVHITPWGTRVTGADAAAPDTIMFLGDSFAFGLGVEDRDTFVSIFCREAAARCLDAAFPGSALASQLDVVEHEFAVWGRPRRLVFVFFAGNDLAEIAAVRTPPGTGLRTAVALNAAVNTSPLFQRVYLIQLAKAEARAWLTPDAMDLMFVTASGAHGEFGRRAADALHAALDRLERVAVRLGFAPPFVLLPDRYQVYADARRDKARYYGLAEDALDMDFPQRVLAAELDRRGVPYTDVRPCLDARDRGLYFERDNHLTARGHAAVAACIVRAHRDGVF